MTRSMFCPRITSSSPLFNTQLIVQSKGPSTVRHFSGAKPFRRRLYEWFYEWPIYFYHRLRSHFIGPIVNPSKQLKELEDLNSRGSSYEDFRKEERRIYGWLGDWKDYPYSEYHRNPRISMERIYYFLLDVYRPSIYLYFYFCFWTLIPYFFYSKLIHNPMEPTEPETWPDSIMKEEAIAGKKTREENYLAWQKMRKMGINVPFPEVRFPGYHKNKEYMEEFELGFPDDEMIEILTQVATNAMALDQRVMEALGKVTVPRGLTKGAIGHEGGILIVPLLGNRANCIMNIIYTRHAALVFEVRDLTLDFTTTGERLIVPIAKEYRILNFMGEEEIVLPEPPQVQEVELQSF